MELSDKKKLKIIIQVLKDLNPNEKVKETAVFKDHQKKVLEKFDPLGEHYWDILKAMTPEQNHQVHDILIENKDLEKRAAKCNTIPDLMIFSNEQNLKEAVINALLEVI